MSFWDAHFPPKKMVRAHESGQIIIATSHGFFGAPNGGLVREIPYFREI